MGNWFSKFLFPNAGWKGSDMISLMNFHASIPDPIQLSGIGSRSEINGVISRSGTVADKSLTCDTN